MNLCECGCGQEIIIKPHHKYTGIPKFIHSHYTRIKNPMKDPVNAKKNSEAKKGKKKGPFSEDHKRKIGEANTGNKRPDLSERNKQRVGDKHPMFGRGHQSDVPTKNKLCKKSIPDPILCKCGCGQYAKLGNEYINGHNGKKPKPEPKLCKCGCGGYANPGYRFISGHQNRKIKPEPKPCECSCGGYAKSGKRFINGHSGILNKGKNHPEVSERNKQKTGKNNPMFGRLGKENPNFGQERPQVSIQMLKEKNHNWKGGISKLPYSFDFNEELKELIRKRDNYICQLCKKSGKTIHHIDYNKDNCDPKDLITLCKSCNAKVNYNRNLWTIYFNQKMNLQYRDNWRNNVY